MDSTTADNDQRDGATPDVHDADTGGADCGGAEVFPRVDPLDSGPNRGRKVLILTTVGVAVTAAVWLYIIFGYRPALMIDELPDRTFPRKAEQVCAEAKSELDELPLASQARTAADRADEVEESNRILGRMVDSLVPLAPSAAATADQRTKNFSAAVQEWLEDWRTYLGDRQSYVTRLRVDPDARFLETSKGSPTKGITRAITAYAQVNRMDSCATPADLS